MYIGGLVQVKGYKDKEILCMNDPFLITENEQDLRIYPVYRNYKGISKEAYEKQSVQPTMICQKITYQNV